MVWDFRSVVQALIISRVSEGGGVFGDTAAFCWGSVGAEEGASEEWKWVRRVCVVRVRSMRVRRSFGFAMVGLRLKEGILVVSAGYCKRGLFLVRIRRVKSVCLRGVGCGGRSCGNFGGAMTRNYLSIRTAPYRERWQMNVPERVGS